MGIGVRKLQGGQEMQIWIDKTGALLQVRSDQMEGLVCAQTRSGKVGGLVSAQIWQLWPSGVFADPIRQGGGFSVRTDLARVAIRRARRPDPAWWRV